MRRALALCACFAAGLSLFAVGGVAGAADGLTTTSTPAPTTTAPAPTSSSTTTTVATTTTATAATTTAPATTTTTAPATTTTASSTTTTTTRATTTTTTTATTTTTPAPAEPAPGWLAWWIQLLGSRGRGRQAPATTTTTAKVTTTAASAKSSGAAASSSSSSAAAEAAAAPEIVQPPAPAHLVVTAKATPGDLTVGSTLTLTYTLQNTGARPVAALLTDELPAPLAPIYVQTDQGTCNGDAKIACALGSVGPGRSIDVVVVAQVVAAASFANDIAVVAADDGVAVDGPPTLRFKATASAAVRLALPR